MDLDDIIAKLLLRIAAINGVVYARLLLW